MQILYTNLIRNLAQYEEKFVWNFRDDDLRAAILANLHFSFIELFASFDDTNFSKLASFLKIIMGEHSE